jgi:hypothetical protein
MEYERVEPLPIKSSSHFQRPSFPEESKSSPPPGCRTFTVRSLVAPRRNLMISCCLGIIWRKSLLAIWRKACACRSWQSCRQRLGILRYHASGCLSHIEHHRSSFLGQRRLYIGRSVANSRATQDETPNSLLRMSLRIFSRVPIALKNAQRREAHYRRTDYLGLPSQEYCQAKETVWKVPPILASSPSL